MVVVKVEMWPKGDETKSYSLGNMTIALKGVDEKGLRRYDWAITKFGAKGIWKKGSIDGHNPRAHGPWDLMYRILCLSVGLRNKASAAE